VIALAGFQVGSFQVPLQIVLLGVITGATYGVLAVGLVLVYRSNRLINFAHGEIGAFAAALLGVAVVAHGLSYWLMFPLALLVGGGTGALTEVAVVRRLRHVPRLMSLVATLGAAQVLLAFEAVASAQARTGSLYPQPPGFPAFNLGTLHVTPAYTAMAILSPVVVAAIALFLRYSRYGVAIRAAADNPDAARLASVSVSRMSTLSWAIAGALSAFTAIMIFPTQSFLSAEAFGPDLLLRALTAAVIARMSSMTVAMVAGVGVGIVEGVLYWNFPSGGPVEAILFAVIVIALLFQPGVAGRRFQQGTWAALQGWRPVPAPWRRVWAVRHLGGIVAAIALAIAVGGPLLPSFGFGAAFELATIFAIATVGLSVFVVTGLAGQLSLGQFAFAGIGAWIAFNVSQVTGNYLAAVFAGGAAAAAVSVAVGIPALRIRGLMLAVTTLAFALMTSSWLLQQPWTLGAGVTPSRPLIAGLALTSSKDYYYFALAFLVLATWLAANIRRGGLGRLLVALRDNEDAARAFTVNVWGRKLQAFAMSGFLAGIGGAVYGFALSRISYNAFLPDQSINVAAMTVIGGIGILAGPLLGAAYILGLPAFVPLDAVTTAATAAGWLLLILYFPGGIAGLLAPQRDRVLRFLVRAGGHDPDALLAEASVSDEAAARPVIAPIAREARKRPARGPLLEVRHVFKSFGGINAVQGVDLAVTEGEILGLIGPNGAGKTTLFELIAGFTRPDRGEIRFEGEPVTRTLGLPLGLHYQAMLPSYMRARRGLVRSFQDAGLFPTMTVLDTVMLAQEGKVPTTLFAAAVGSREAEKAKAERGAELIAGMGLGRYMNTAIQELSTGTRRIVELCCLVALEPRLLLLDEPSSGIAQRETEALAELLVKIKNSLHATLVLIEHDIPLVMGIADRVAAMESGRIISVGTPEKVSQDPAVVEAYLGVEAAAIQRSGARPSRAPARKAKVAT